MEDAVHRTGVPDGLFRRGRDTENIYTLDSKGELLITIMSSLAQEEARNISDNTAWGQRKRFADGKMSLGYSHFLGYKKGAADGEMEIDPQPSD